MNVKCFFLHILLTIFLISLPVDLSLVCRLQEEILLPEVERQVRGQNRLFHYLHYATIRVRAQSLKKKETTLRMQLEPAV